MGRKRSIYKNPAFRDKSVTLAENENHEIEVLDKDGFVIEREKLPETTRARNVNRNNLPTRTFNFKVAEAIAKLVSEGETLTKACEKMELNYGTVRNWQRRYEPFRKIMERAREDRAEFYHDKALEEAMDATDKDDAPAQKLKVETLKWAAGIGDSRKYNSKQKSDAQPPSVHITIKTGVPDAAPIEVKTVSGRSKDE